MLDVDFMLEEEDFDVSNITLVADFVLEWSKSETFGGEVVWVSPRQAQALTGYSGE